MLIIVGGGMAGLLAAQMLRHFNPIVIEKQETLPNNHHAVLRFKHSLVGDVLGIPFRKVTMIKTTLHWRNPIADAVAYSHKNTGVYRSDRSARQFTMEDRYIAPPDLIERMAHGINIRLGQEFDFTAHDSSVINPVISTVPMPVLMEALNYQSLLDFNYRPGWVITALVENCDAYASLMVPDPDYRFSRVSITGNELIIEFPDYDPNLEDARQLKNSVPHAAKLMGIDPQHVFAISEPKAQKYNKIVPIDNDARKSFIHWATDKHNVFSLGRYATWRPTLQLDSLVKDVRLIEEWMRSRYDMQLARRS